MLFVGECVFVFRKYILCKWNMESFLNDDNKLNASTKRFVMDPYTLYSEQLNTF